MSKERRESEVSKSMLDSKAYSSGTGNVQSSGKSTLKRKEEVILFGRR
jgi:hypothetical protein